MMKAKEQKKLGSLAVKGKNKGSKGKDQYKSRHNIGRRSVAGRVFSYKETEYSIVFPDHLLKTCKADLEQAAKSTAKRCNLLEKLGKGNESQTVSSSKAKNADTHKVETQSNTKGSDVKSASGDTSEKETEKGANSKESPKSLTKKGIKRKLSTDLPSASLIKKQPKLGKNSPKNKTQKVSKTTSISSKSPKKEKEFTKLKELTVVIERKSDSGNHSETKKINGNKNKKAKVVKSVQGSKIVKTSKLKNSLIKKKGDKNQKKSGKLPASKTKKIVIGKKVGKKDSRIKDQKNTSGKKSVTASKIDKDNKVNKLQIKKEKHDCDVSKKTSPSKKGNKSSGKEAEKDLQTSKTTKDSSLKPKGNVSKESPHSSKKEQKSDSTKEQKSKTDIKVEKKENQIQIKKEKEEEITSVKGKKGTCDGSADTNNETNKDTCNGAISKDKNQKNSNPETSSKTVKNKNKPVAKNNKDSSPAKKIAIEPKKQTAPKAKGIQQKLKAKGIQQKLKSKVGAKSRTAKFANLLPRPARIQRTACLNAGMINQLILETDEPSSKKQKLKQGHGESSSTAAKDLSKESDKNGEKSAKKQVEESPKVKESKAASNKKSPVSKIVKQEKTPPFKSKPKSSPSVKKDSKKTGRDAERKKTTGGTGYGKRERPPQGAMWEFSSSDEEETDSEESEDDLEKAKRLSLEEIPLWPPQKRMASLNATAMLAASTEMVRVKSENVKPDSCKAARTTKYEIIRKLVETSKGCKEEPNKESSPKKDSGYWVSGMGKDPEGNPVKRPPVVPELDLDMKGPITVTTPDVVVDSKTPQKEPVSVQASVEVPATVPPKDPVKLANDKAYPLQSLQEMHNRVMHPQGQMQGQMNRMPGPQMPNSGAYMGQPPFPHYPHMHQGQGHGTRPTQDNTMPHYHQPRPDMNPMGGPNQPFAPPPPPQHQPLPPNMQHGLPQRPTPHPPTPYPMPPSPVKPTDQSQQYGMNGNQYNLGQMNMMYQRRPPHFNPQSLAMPNFKGFPPSQDSQGNMPPVVYPSGQNFANTNNINTSSNNNNNMQPMVPNFKTIEQQESQGNVPLEQTNCITNPIGSKLPDRSTSQAPPSVVQDNYNMQPVMPNMYGNPDYNGSSYGDYKKYSSGPPGYVHKSAPMGNTCTYPYPHSNTGSTTHCQTYPMGNMTGVSSYHPMGCHRQFGSSAFTLPLYQQPGQGPDMPPFNHSFYQAQGPMMQSLTAESCYPVAGTPQPMGVQHIHTPQVKVLVHNPTVGRDNLPPKSHYPMPHSLANMPHNNITFPGKLHSEDMTRRIRSVPPMELRNPVASSPAKHPSSKPPASTPEKQKVVKNERDSSEKIILDLSNRVPQSFKTNAKGERIDIPNPVSMNSDNYSILTIGIDNKKPSSQTKKEEPKNRYENKKKDGDKKVDTSRSKPFQGEERKVYPKRENRTPSQGYTEDPLKRAAATISKPGESCKSGDKKTPVKVEDKTRSPDLVKRDERKRSHDGLKKSPGKREEKSDECKKARKEEKLASPSNRKQNKEKTEDVGMKSPDVVKKVLDLNRKSPGVSSKKGSEAYKKVPEMGIKSPGVSSKKGSEAYKKVPEMGIKSPGVSSKKGSEAYKKVPEMGIKSPGVSNKKGSETYKKVPEMGMKSPELPKKSPGARKKEFIPQCDWKWDGEPEKRLVYPVNDSPPVMRNTYKAMKHENGDVISVRDCVLIKSGPRKKDIPYVAKIVSLWEKEDIGDKVMSVLWYYRPEHTESDRLPRHVPNEVFASKHRDEASVACIEDRCYVLTLGEYCRYRTEQRRIATKCPMRLAIVPESEEKSERQKMPPMRVDPECVFLCRRVYDIKLKRVLKNPTVQSPLGKSPCGPPSGPRSPSGRPQRSPGHSPQLPYPTALTTSPGTSIIPRVIRPPVQTKLEPATFSSIRFSATSVPKAFQPVVPLITIDSSEAMRGKTSISVSSAPNIARIKVPSPRAELKKYMSPVKLSHSEPCKEQGVIPRPSTLNVHPNVSKIEKAMKDLSDMSSSKSNTEKSSSETETKHESQDSKQDTGAVIDISTNPEVKSKKNKKVEEDTKMECESSDTSKQECEKSPDTLPETSSANQTEEPMEVDVEKVSESLNSNNNNNKNGELSLGNGSDGCKSDKQDDAPTVTKGKETVKKMTGDVSESLPSTSIIISADVHVSASNVITEEAEKSDNKQTSVNEAMPCIENVEKQGDETLETKGKNEAKKDHLNENKNENISVLSDDGTKKSTPETRDNSLDSNLESPLQKIDKNVVPVSVTDKVSEKMDETSAVKLIQTEKDEDKGANQNQSSQQNQEPESNITQFQSTNSDSQKADTSDIDIDKSAVNPTNGASPAESSVSIDEAETSTSDSDLQSSSQKVMTSVGNQTPKVGNLAQIVNNLTAKVAQKKKEMETKGTMSEHKATSGSRSQHSPGHSSVKANHHQSTSDAGTSPRKSQVATEKNVTQKTQSSGQNGAITAATPLVKTTATQSNSSANNSAVVSQPIKPAVLVVPQLNSNSTPKKDTKQKGVNSNLELVLDLSTPKK